MNKGDNVVNNQAKQNNLEVINISTVCRPMSSQKNKDRSN